MTFKSFLKLVELPTKVASVFPFMIGTLYAVYRFDMFNTRNFIIMLVAMLCLDMATTALNNYMDYKTAVKTHGFNYEQHNAIVKFGLSENTVRGTIGLLAGTAVVLGLVLYTRTDLVVLLLGMLSFACAVLYTWGPVPISRTPLGEAVSGIIMGGVITFISLYIHIADAQIIGYSLEQGMLFLRFDLFELVGIGVVVLPLIAGIANIMLANNTCDMDDDFVNKRFTLPLVLGKERALKLFAGLYAIGYVGITAGVLFKWIPVTCLLVLATILPVRKHVQAFYKLQTKKDTFITSVQNFIVISAVYVVTLGVGILF